MGFMDKLKQMKNFVTGGHAKVFLEIVEPSLDEPFTLKVKAVVGDAPVKVARVYGYIKGSERVTIENVKVSEEHTEVVAEDEYGDGEVVDREVEVGHRDVSRTKQTAYVEVNIAGAQELEANQEYTWEAEVKIPADSLPTYDGFNATHFWFAQAGLDVAGNDPDSGWIKFEAY